MTVSVLIPAYRAKYVGQAIASVLAQGYEDFELLVNDDSIGDEVKAVVERFADPRIRYSRTAGREGGAANARQLWEMARHDLIKYLFDDDLLLPHALPELVAQMESNPGASFVFGHRDIIDDGGRVTAEPRLLGAGKVVVVEPEKMAEITVSTVRNLVGEYCNLLMNRAAGLVLDDLLAYNGVPVEALTDVAFFLNATRKAPAVGVGRTISQFRRHANQNSTPGFHPLFHKTLFEWELFLRGEFAGGRLTPEQALAGLGRLEVTYAHWLAQMPELGRFIGGHPALKARIQAGERDVFDDAFRACWDEASAAATARVAREGSRLQSLQAAGEL
ncbi:glycosyltransferase family 2 protein [Phenylobacterium sp.]|uniref:glycosyltransferase family 2 protein n=1 Tax=Phenylobacterium sp. TaxID=1871053 RepID=UPI002D18BF34|nr:glycosyltransferase family 2 protein [Phenylobacterium sp.]HVI34556.1 glycosyltransferase family 2 protein [Phenylobacterium sp.]